MYTMQNLLDDCRAEYLTIVIAKLRRHAIPSHTAAQTVLWKGLLHTLQTIRDYPESDQGYACELLWYTYRDNAVAQENWAELMYEDERTDEARLADALAYSNCCAKNLLYRFVCSEEKRQGRCD